MTYFRYYLLSSLIDEVAKILRLKKFSILGHSMGGKVAMNLCQKSPEMIENIAIMDISTVDYYKRKDWDIPKVVSHFF